MLIALHATPLCLLLYAQDPGLFVLQQKIAHVPQNCLCARLPFKMPAGANASDTVGSSRHIDLC
jgi:hypothetical protein